jgi:cytoplasmic iron level regulating protein YaaA (DUF328/UPF0246 family)
MASQDFLVLLPPSEGKAEGGVARTSWDPHSGVFGSSLGDYRFDVCERLIQIKGGDARLLGVKGVHLERALQANRSLIGAPTLPAWQRYTGVVWDHLSLPTMTTTDRQQAISRLFVPSGLMGIVRADDPVPDYRLKMGARLTPFGAMAKWWRDDLTEAFVSVVKKRTVVDVLPNEHRAAFDFSQLQTVLRVDLVSRTGGVVGGHNAKAAKGLLVRHLLLTKGSTIERMVSTFAHPEYTAVITEGSAQ